VFRHCSVLKMTEPGNDAMVSVTARPRFAARYALACVVALVSVFAAVAHGAPPVAGSFVDGTLASAAGRLSYEVYLPPGYSNSGRRYPVIYYLHGLPAGPEAYRSFGYVPAAVELTGLQAIIVAPQAATATDTDPEYLNKGVGQTGTRRLQRSFRTGSMPTFEPFRTVPDARSSAPPRAATGRCCSVCITSRDSLSSNRGADTSTRQTPRERSRSRRLPGRTRTRSFTVSDERSSFIRP
jgi:Putative esterase